MSGGSTRIRTRSLSLTPRAIRAACALFNAAASAAPLPGGTRINARSPCSPPTAPPPAVPSPHPQRNRRRTGRRIRRPARPWVQAPTPRRPRAVRGPPENRPRPERSRTRRPSVTPAETPARPARRVPAPRAPPDPTAQAPARAAGSARRPRRPCRPPLVPYQRRGADPPPQRVLPGPQIGPAEHGPPVEQQGSRVPALGDRLGSRRAHDQRGRPRHGVQHMFPPGGPHGHGGEGPPQFLRGPPRSHDLRPEPVAPALGAVPAGLLAPAPPAEQGPGGVPRLQRTRTVHAPRGLPAPRAGHPRHIAPPRHLHEHGPVPEAVPRDLPGKAGQPSRPSRLVPREVPVPHGPHQRRGSPHLLPPGHDRRGPPTLDELGGLDRTTPTPQQEGALVPRGPQLQHFPHMREGSVVITVAGVPVVPDDDQPRIPHRREHGRPGPDHSPYSPRRTASHSRYRRSCPASAVSSACRPSPSSSPSASSTRAAGRPAGTTTRAPARRPASPARPARSPRPTPAPAARSTRPGAHPHRPAPAGTLHRARTSATTPARARPEAAPARSSPRPPPGRAGAERPAAARPRGSPHTDPPRPVPAPAALGPAPAPARRPARARPGLRDSPIQRPARRGTRRSASPLHAALP